MKAIILSGGYGTRLQEETALKPKPMVEIGGRPMLWHIMGIYAAAGFKEFVVALGYRAESVRSYFVQYHLIHSDLTVCLGDGSVSSRRTVPEDAQIDIRGLVALRHQALGPFQRLRNATLGKRADP